MFDIRRKNPSLGFMGKNDVKTVEERRLAFLENVRTDRHFFVLFNQMDEVLFFAKDREGRLWAGNQALLERYHLREESELWGKTDFELLPPSMAQKFREDDLRILASGEPMLDILEIYPDADGIPAWFLTNKLPICTPSNEVIGVMGTIHPYMAYRGLQPRLRDIAEALTYMREHFAEEIAIPDLAKMSGLSLRQFERKFKALMRMTPQQFLMRSRVHAACEALRETMRSIGDVALECGFYDQSSFTRHFGRHIGMTPLQYRKKYR